MSKSVITIPLDQFAELIRKECAYDIFARHVKKDPYASDIEKMLFVESNKGPIEDAEKEDDF